MGSTSDYTTTWVCQFVAELLERTRDLTDDTSYQCAVQRFVDEHRPWMPPIPNSGRSLAPIFSRLELDESGDSVIVEWTPEGLACFQGWLRRQGLDPMMGQS